MTTPTFLIAGGQRCGTTTLWHLLNQHPNVYLAQPVAPEPRFFICERTENPEEYERIYFSDVGTATAVGEKSTSYLEVEGTAECIAAAYPDMRLIFLLRHPVERAVSNYLFSTANGLESREFSQAVAGQNEPYYEKTRIRKVSPFSYIRRGRYTDLLRPYRQHFADNQILILFFDDLVEDPEALCRKTFDFLGVHADAPLTLPFDAANRGPDREPMMSRAILDSLIAEFRFSNDELASMAGRNLDAWNYPSEHLLQCVF